jgi:hypothetical protein
LNAKLKYCTVLLLAVAFSSCNLTKLVPDDKQLLVQNKIEREDSRGVDLSEENSNLKLKPNRKILGFIRFHLWAHQYGTKGIGIRKKQGWSRRLAEKIGESPVLVDSSKLELSAKRLSEYYFSKGFLNNEVNYKVAPKKLLRLVELNKRSVVTYQANLGSVFRINKLEFNAASQDIDFLIRKNESEQILKLNQRLDFDRIEAERNRLVEMLRNNGYYYFNNSFIDFQIDTNQYSGKALVVVNIRNMKNYEPHLQQTIDSIIVKIEGNQPGDTTATSKGFVIYGSEYYLKPAILEKNIIIGVKELYNADKVQRTYSNLLSMGIFNFVTIRFRPSYTDSANMLVAEINLKPATKHDLIWEPQAITTDQNNAIQSSIGRNFGIANSITLRNRNVFGGAESFNIASYTAIEAQFKGGDNGLVNNFRQSVSTELIVPSLIYFERKEVSQKLIRKNTKITASFLYDQNINFTRKVFPLNYTYNFAYERFTFGLTPFRISLNNANPEPDFLASLDPETQFYTTQLLTDNLIIGPNVSLFWTNKLDKPNNYISVRSSPFELSGNLISLYFDVFTNKTGINKEVFGVKYSQYTRSDIDLVYTNIIDENNSLVYRFYGGAGVPYGNTTFLPFERRFFVGGGNSLRAWRPRTIGPGAYSDTLNVISIEKTGELMLQANFEYRFDIIDKYLDGALFFDAGNIWNFRKNDNFEDAEFKFDRFYKEIALNTGLGLRFDFTYVIFRVDWGIAMHDPSYADGSRWVIKDFFSNRWVNDNTAVNFAVGFPF